MGNHLESPRMARGHLENWNMKDKTMIGGVMPSESYWIEFGKLLFIYQSGFQIYMVNFLVSDHVDF